MIFKTKGDYISKLINNDHSSIMYSMYCEKFDSSKHSKHLSFNEFIVCINSWWFEMAAIVSMQYYEDKFNVMMVRDLKGNLIAVI
jgi:hypothetical protein